LVDHWIENTVSNLKFIIAPHEIKENEILKMVHKYNGTAIRYSDWIKNPTGIFKILIIDNVGLLSRIYKFANYAYIGGGFGVGIHNILEAAVFGMPVFFGPNYKKFNEAVELIKSESVFSVNDANELLSIFNGLEKDLQAYNYCAETNKQYVESRKGATRLVIDYLQFNLIS
jgi:3-deoxy-D-manno-octulosonic-acid transferase